MKNKGSNKYILLREYKSPWQFMQEATSKLELFPETKEFGTQHDPSFEGTTWGCDLSIIT